MLPDDSGIRVDFSDRLARLLQSDSAFESLRLAARLSSLPSQQQEFSPPAHADAGLPSSVGIWQRETAGNQDEFVRKVPSNEEAWLWADRERIGAKRGRRVVLLGESVARGFLYDPAFNPALALQAMLSSAALQIPEVDVVDLARHDCSRATLLQLATDARILEPDAYVVFCGNNWNPYGTLDRKDLREIAYILRKDRSLFGVRAMLESKLRAEAETLVDAIAGIAAARSIPAVLMIPEFNLCDWRSGCSTAVNFLDSRTASKWRRLESDAQDAFHNGAYDKAEQFAGAMLALDGGSTSLPLEILGHCRLAAGDLAASRESFEQARDTTLFSVGSDSPRCFKTIQEVFRRRAAIRGIHVIDLPRRLQHYTGGLPDARMFVDYCHLTAEGIGVSMAWAAELLSPLLGGPRLDWSKLKAAAPAVDPHCLAEAQFLAAIHNAHWRQPYDTVRRHCDSALAEDPDIAKTMLNFLDFYIRRCPTVLCRSFRESANVAEPAFPQRHSFHCRDSKAEKILNPILVDAVIDALGTRFPDARRRTTDLLRQERGPNGSAINLLEPAYWCSCYSLREFRRESSGYFKSFSPETTFVIPNQPGQGLRLSMTLRTRRRSGVWGNVRLEMNGRHVATFNPLQDWQTRVIEIPPDDLQDGLNVLRVQWPAADWPGPDHLPRIADAFESARETDIYPLYGEIHAFVAAAQPAYLQSATGQESEAAICSGA
jgi:hypothetical protein